MDNAVDVKGVELTLCDVPDYLTFSEAEATTRTLGFSVLATETVGCVRVLVFSVGGYAIPTGSGSIVALRFAINSDALPGDVAMQLSDCIVADINNLPLPVTPVDGALEIIPTPAPTATPTPTPTPVAPIVLRVDVREKPHMSTMIEETEY
jgi:hypothetical protein